MSEDMNLSLNGNSKVPPGFRFHPTEEELLQYYLRKKVASERIDLDVIRDVDLNKLEPWDIQEKCKIGSTPQNDWYFFSHKDKKYPTGTRTNRATAAGFWKATGRDKAIHSNFRRIGMRKTLVFYRGRAPHGQKSDWIMHEYRLEDNTQDSASDSGPEEGWVVCRVFKKKNYHKALESPSLIAPSSNSFLPRNDGVLDQILMYMGRSASASSSSRKQEKEFSTTPFSSNPFIQLPALETPQPDMLTEIGPPSDWAALDRLVASHLNGQPCRQFSGINDEFAFSFGDPGDDAGMMSMHDGINGHDHPEPDLWSFGRSSSSLSSSSDPLCHLSV